ncbi:hypothetical protein PoHVEF18_005490 [Penicillium ochrochloron]
MTVDAEVTLDALAPAHSLVKQREVTAEGGAPQVPPSAAYPQGAPSDDEYPGGFALLFILLSHVLSIVTVAVDQVALTPTTLLMLVERLVPSVRSELMAQNSSYPFLREPTKADNPRSGKRRTPSTPASSPTAAASDRLAKKAPRKAKKK